MCRPSAIATHGSQTPPAAAVGADAVERPGDDPGSRGLADAADPGQEERVRDPAAVQGVAQGPDQGILADQLREPLRTMDARQHPVGARCLVGRSAVA
jgi:hypothetical protein